MGQDARVSFPVTLHPLSTNSKPAIFHRGRSYNTSPVPSLQPCLADIMNGIDKYELQFKEIKRSNPAHIFLKLDETQSLSTTRHCHKFGPGVDAREAQTMQFIM